jgi:hypothetical protein
MSEIQRDVVAEGKRLLERAASDGVTIRVLGGVAVRLHSHNLRPAFEREYGDLDFVTTKKDAGGTVSLLRAAGYEPHVAFNALNGRERMLFFDNAHDRQVDVFVGSFRMSHEIPLEGRLRLEAATVPLAELLLTKLQIIELNEKDVRDSLAILHEHPVGEGDEDTVNEGRIAELLAGDWGLWRTITANLAACRGYLDRYELPEADQAEIGARIDRLEERIEAEPKSRGWKLRARVGDRKRWYQVPEEVAGGP